MSSIQTRRRPAYGSKTRAFRHPPQQFQRSRAPSADTARRPLISRVSDGPTYGPSWRVSLMPMGPEAPPAGFVREKGPRMFASCGTTSPSAE
jgi:hypothetical protein